MRQLAVYFYHGVGSYAHNVELHTVRGLLLVNVIANVADGIVTFVFIRHLYMK